MNTKHTPGPWKADRRTRKGWQTISSEDYWWDFAKVIVRMADDDEDSKIGIANLHLILAAPDLLEAARELKDVCNRPSAARTRAEAWRAMDKAIAKAEGRA